MNEKEETIKKINKTLDKIRPFINRDGGDIQFIKFEDGIVYVKFLGACEGCAMIGSTLNDGVQTILQEEVPGVLGVQLVD